jgi:type I restriction enzyme R subunit
MNKKSLTETDIRSKFITPALVGANGEKWNLPTQMREWVSHAQPRKVARWMKTRRSQTLHSLLTLSAPRRHFVYGSTAT